MWESTYVRRRPFWLSERDGEKVYHYPKHSVLSGEYTTAYKVQEHEILLLKARMIFPPYSIHAGIIA